MYNPIGCKKVAISSSWASPTAFGLGHFDRKSQNRGRATLPFVLFRNMVAEKRRKYVHFLTEIPFSQYTLRKISTFKSANINWKIPFQLCTLRFLLIVRQVDLFISYIWTCIWIITNQKKVLPSRNFHLRNKKRITLNFLQGHQIGFKPSALVIILAKYFINIFKKMLGLSKVKRVFCVPHTTYSTISMFYPFLKTALYKFWTSVRLVFKSDF